MPELGREASLIAEYQREADDTVRRVAIEIERLGGRNAVDGYLLKSICNLLGIAITEQGPAGACELMAAGLLTAEEYAGKTVC